MNCRECEAQLGAYLDDELSAEQEAEMASHLRGCSDCAGEEERLLAVREALQTQRPMLEAPELLRARIRGAIRAEAAPTVVKRGAPGSALRLVAMAAVLMVAVIGSWQLSARRAAGDRLVEGVLTGHVRSLIGTHLTDVATSDQHTVKPWFNGKLDYSPPVYDFTGRGYPLIGGRLDYVDGQTVAALVYGRRQHLINVFLWPVSRGRGEGPAALTRQGYHMLHWESADYTYWVISDLGTIELGEFASLVRQGESAASAPYGGSTAPLSR